MLVTTDQGNILMLQKAKKPGEKSTKVGNLIMNFGNYSYNFMAFAVDPCYGG